ncbi:MAG: hypothetical protein GX971_09150 [Firmicutes bacterium]|nr:hypothetical protein [Bacillota bacterium]
MITLAQSDVLRALKRCLCLAKQDLVFCDYLDNSMDWRSYALARYEIYNWLQKKIIECGVNQTYLLATKRYAGLPLFVSGSEQKGEQEALEVFFQFIAGDRPMHAKINA